METKEKILVESLLLFLDKGINKVTIDDIAKKVEVTPGTIYYYFKNKLDLVNTVMIDFYLNETNKELNKVKSFEGTVKEKISYMSYLIFIYQPPSVDSKKLDEKISKKYNNRDLILLLTETIKYSDEIARKNKEVNHNLKKVITDILNEGKLNNEIKEDVNIEKIATVIYTFFLGSFFSTLTDSEDIAHEELNNNLANLWSLIGK